MSYVKDCKNCGRKFRTSNKNKNYDYQCSERLKPQKEEKIK